MEATTTQGMTDTTNQEQVLTPEQRKANREQISYQEAKREDPTVLSRGELRKEHKSLGLTSFSRNAVREICRTLNIKDAGNFRDLCPSALLRLGSQAAESQGHQVSALKAGDMAKPFIHREGMGGTSRTMKMAASTEGRAFADTHNKGTEAKESKADKALKRELTEIKRLENIAAISKEVADENRKNAEERYTAAKAKESEKAKMREERQGKLRPDSKLNKPTIPPMPDPERPAPTPEPQEPMTSAPEESTQPSPMPAPTRAKCDIPACKGGGKVLERGYFLIHSRPGELAVFREQLVAACCEVCEEDMAIENLMVDLHTKVDANEIAKHHNEEVAARRRAVKTFITTYAVNIIAVDSDSSSN